jgi:hypothetical protein
MSAKHQRLETTRRRHIGRDEHDDASVHLSHGVSQIHPSGSGLQKEDFVRPGMPVSEDCLSGREVFQGIALQSLISACRPKRSYDEWD